MSSENKSSDLVLVTGASGYIATHVVQQLIQAGYKVRGTVRSLSNPEKVKPIQDLAPEAGQLELVEADLLDPSGWPKAVEGVKYVMHVASPFLMLPPEREEELIKPAVEGTLNVLRACSKSKTVKRVVLTSSVVAVYGNQKSIAEGQVFTEKDWTDTTKDDCSAYAKSKTLAEEKAWDFVKGLREEEKFELVAVNPALVLGPPLCGASGTSMNIIKSIMEHKMSGLQKMSFPVVDVRDVAAAHLAAMKTPEAAGNRHILSGENKWMTEIGEVLSKEFKSQGYNPLTTLEDESSPGSPSFVADNTRFMRVLKIEPRPVEQAIIDMVYSMIDSGKIEKKEGYKPRD